MRDSRFISCKRLTFSCLHVSLAVSWLRLLLRCCVNVAVRRLARLCQSLRNIPFRLAEQPVLNGKTWCSALRRRAFGPVQPAFQRFPAVSVSVSFGAGGAIFQEISRHRADCAGPFPGSLLAPALLRFARHPIKKSSRYGPLSIFFLIFAYANRSQARMPKPFQWRQGRACGCQRIVC